MTAIGRLQVPTAEANSFLLRRCFSRSKVLHSGGLAVMARRSSPWSTLPDWHRVGIGGRCVTMSRKNSRLRSLLRVLIVVLLTSCGSDGRRPVFPVSGHVVFEGKPTPDALVIFHPVNDPDPLAPHPLTRVAADGSFSLTTYAMNDGAPAGEYKV